MALLVEDTFHPRIALRWRTTQVGGGRLVLGEAGLRLLLAGARRRRYADAQIDDYTGLARRDFPWRPPRRRRTCRWRWGCPATAGRPPVLTRRSRRRWLGRHWRCQ